MPRLVAHIIAKTSAQENTPDDIFCKDLCHFGPEMEPAVCFHAITGSD